MLAYQTEYLGLLKSASESVNPSAYPEDPMTFIEEADDRAKKSALAVERGTALLKRNLFPLLDNILSATDEDIDLLEEFAGNLMSMTEQSDVGLYYRIHLALLSYARQKKLRDMLIKELYLCGMALHNLETMLSPNNIRLYTARMRLYFSESASYFETEYDDITDPETRGYIHRSMGNIALSYPNISDEKTARAKLEVLKRSIGILSDPSVREKTPSLPWDVFLYKSHQERTTLMSFLRSGNAGPDVFAQVLESALFIEERQQREAREKGKPLQPRWQYAYLAARYHCGAISIEDFLGDLYSMASQYKDEYETASGVFTHLSVPALYMTYLGHITDEAEREKHYGNVKTLADGFFDWMVSGPSDSSNEKAMFFARQFLYSYIEVPDGIRFSDVLLNVFAARHPPSYLRMWIAGRTAEQLAKWAVEDCPEKLTGLEGTTTAEEVVKSKDGIASFILKAGTFYDVGTVHFVNMEATACRGIFEDEEALINLHTVCGAELLEKHESTKRLAAAARGHHFNFDGKGGYPMDFTPADNSERAMVCLVAVADLLASTVNETASRYRPAISFEQACKILEDGSGTRYAPFVAGLLQKPGRREQLSESINIWKRMAYLDMYRRREKMKL